MGIWEVAGKHFSKAPVDAMNHVLCHVLKASVDAAMSYGQCCFKCINHVLKPSVDATTDYGQCGTQPLGRSGVVAGRLLQRFLREVCREASEASVDAMNHGPV